MHYKELSPKDQPLIPFGYNFEVKKWYKNVFDFAIWGDAKPEIYFEDGLSAPIVQYASFNVEGRVGSRPIYARPPFYREILNCDFYQNLRHGSVIAYNGISGVSREGMNWMTLCCRPLLSFDPTPFFKGNSYLYPLSEGVKKASIPSRFHLKTVSAGEELKCNTEMAVGRTLVLPSIDDQMALFDAIIKDLNSSVRDGVFLRLAWMVAYLLQPFELVQLSLDASCRVIKGEGFIEWVKNAPASELTDVVELSEAVQNRVEFLFDLLYGVDESDTGETNRQYLVKMVRFVQRMFNTNMNENVTSAKI